jgi:hypothetical protein
MAIRSMMKIAALVLLSVFIVSSEVLTFRDYFGVCFLLSSETLVNLFLQDNQGSAGEPLFNYLSYDRHDYGIIFIFQ